MAPWWRCPLQQENNRMKGLAGVRVLVVDNDESEALPVLKALAKRGIAAAFFNGKPSQLPNAQGRLSGVRLAILDMDLVEGGVSNRNKAVALVQVLQRILAPDNGPYGVVAWTKHPEIRDEFETALFQAGIARPIFTAMIEKATCKTTKGTFRLDVLMQKLDEASATAGVLRFIQHWEELCAQSSTDVTNRLSVLAESSAATDLATWRNRWLTDFKRILRGIAVAEIEKHLTADTCLPAIYSALMPIQADAMEGLEPKWSKVLPNSGTEIFAQQGACAAVTMAKIHSALHLSGRPPVSGGAGLLYLLTPAKVKKFGVSFEDLLKDLMQAQNGQVPAANLATALEHAKAVAVEVSPVCDHAQKKVRMARLLLGVFVPQANRNIFNTKLDYAWSCGPLDLSPLKQEGAGFIVLSARHLVAMDPQSIAKKLGRPRARLRGQALIHLQAKLTQNIMKPDLMLLQG